MGESPALSDSERVFEDLVRAAHDHGPIEALELADRYARALGLTRVNVHLVDLQQRVLVPLVTGPELDVDSTLAGEAYRFESMRLAEGESGLNLWLPLMNGSDRMGVLHVVAGALDRPTLHRCRTLAALLSLIINSQRAHSDTYLRRIRKRNVDLRTEMLRAFLPPRSVGTERGVSTAVLEPAYGVGGDAYDHSITRDVLHATILDAMGHDLASGLTAAVAMAGARNARRSGAGLAQLTGNVGAALSEWLPDQFCTGVFSTLDLAGGVFSWINCGHPAPLLIRRQELVGGALDRPAEPPLGLGLEEGRSHTLHQIQLEPGDQILMYTDGVVEARDSHGEMFGLERFVEFIIRATAGDERTPETLRRLIQDIRDYQQGHFTDDATIMLIQWCPTTRFHGDESVFGGV
ncbi:serine/threonine-protein phosphatase [Nocardiopsis sp. HNM0947]|uniref:Serine/threonine-protein phosphatase n=1 Tax=Nocardiopsis coralli TaxID=2772213 RepID=A0ABR9P725_9ACTN|nr:PP2C family protein-serine/threonine phosphatase [Nocardiopsis coralli]MBE2999650.1 serine/threonine-protein phosphatase [Nocardiopsis coralli]